jgi:Rieske Fe-S protein
MSAQELTRRSVLSGSAVAVLAAVAGYVVARRSDAATTGSSSSAANGYVPPAAGDRPEPLVALAKVTGDGTIAGGVVLTRDGSGGVHGVSATCTHQGCTLLKPKDGKVSCPCHASVFDAVSGKVLRGPATQPLPEVPVHVQGDQVYRG